MEEQVTSPTSESRLKDPEFQKQREETLLTLLNDPTLPHDSNGRISWKQLWVQRPGIREKLGADSELGLARCYAIASYLDPKRREAKKAKDRERLQKARAIGERRASRESAQTNNNQPPPTQAAWQSCPRCGLNFAQLAVALRTIDKLQS